MTPVREWKISQTEWHNPIIGLSGWKVSNKSPRDSSGGMEKSLLSGNFRISFETLSPSTSPAPIIFVSNSIVSLNSRFSVLGSEVSDFPGRLNSQPTPLLCVQPTTANMTTMRIMVLKALIEL